MKTSLVLLAVYVLILPTTASARPVRAPAAPAEHPAREPVALETLHYGGPVAKAVVDTTVLMGPGGLYPFRGDFETAWAKPCAEGLLPDGWTSCDLTGGGGNHWHVDTHNNPGTGYGLWCGSAEFPACDATDSPDGYGNRWYDVLEFRKSVAGAATVRVQATLRYDTEPGYDYLSLLRRTAAAPDFEPVAGGQGQAWDGRATVNVDRVFNYTAAELAGGTDIAIAFVFDSDDVWSDEDCLWPTAGAATIDDITVTIDDGRVSVYTEDFEDASVGPDWILAPDLSGTGDFSRIWSRLGDADPCSGNPSNQIAFLDDGLVVPGTGGTVGAAGYDYATPEGWVMTKTGGRLDNGCPIEHAIISPMMPLPPAGGDGLTLSFDAYLHETPEAFNDTTHDVYFAWSVRSIVAGDVDATPWVERSGYYSTGPRYRRLVVPLGDLLPANSTAIQVRLRVRQLCWWWSCSQIPTSSPAPYFDNVRVEVHPATGPFIVASERWLANDAFPASGVVDLVDLSANSVRFDMASGISNLRTDPGDSVCVDVTPRTGATLDPPVMHWTLARRNPLFDPYRRLLAGPVIGRVTRDEIGMAVPNRWNFDLPDTGLLFPGDVLHYYFAATDHRNGDSRISTLPADLTGYGDPDSRAWSGLCTVRCLPSVSDAAGAQPQLLVWNDQGLTDGARAWYGAVDRLGLREGVDYDLFVTHAPADGSVVGLGGRAAAAQIAGYADLLYTAGDLYAYTLCSSDFRGDDVGLLTTWLALGGRDLLLTGDDLAHYLYQTGTASRAFLETRMGVTFHDRDVGIDLDWQRQPVVASLSGNPVFPPSRRWRADGGCPIVNDFDAVTPRGGAVRLAQFTASDGLSTPYVYGAAILNVTGTSRVVSLNHDLCYVSDPPEGSVAKSPSPRPARDELLADVLTFFGVPLHPGSAAAVPGAGAFTVESYPNPFNPRMTVRYLLSAPGPVTVRIFNVRGELVRTLLDGPVAQAAGMVTWDGATDGGAPSSSGLYFVEARASGQVHVEKITLVR